MSEDEITIKAQQLAAGTHGEKLAKFPLLFAKAAFFGPRPSKDRPSEVRNGTVSLVDLGEGPLAVTCEHVIAGYTEMEKEHDDLVFQIGPIEINLREQLIDKNARLDLATIRLTEKQVASITSEGEIGSCIFQPKTWPPDDSVKRGQFVAFGGFPGYLRTGKNRTREQYPLILESIALWHLLFMAITRKPKQVRRVSPFDWLI